MTRRVHIGREVRLPDEVRVARSRRAPELGPRILFLSGGSALRKLSRVLKLYTHNSIHLITPFDSGGSSARLREAFHMLSVGDLRNRLMSLADETVRGNPEIYELFSTRFEADGDPLELGRRLQEMVDGKHPLVTAVPEPMRQLVRTHLRFFAEKMPLGFDLRGASIGNLILAGGYLSHDHDIDSVVFLFSRLVEARGIVRPVVDADLHLAAELRDGSRVVGQHQLTGKQVPPIPSPVRDLFLVDDLVEPRRAEIALPERNRSLMEDADLICFPMGSFYSSVVANLLPTGMGRAIVGLDCPRVYVPNTGTDPEQLGMTLGDAVDTLIEFVRRDAGSDTPIERILNLVLVDTGAGVYPEPLDLDRIRDLGIEVVDLDLVSRRHRPYLDAERLARVLLSLA